MVKERKIQSWLPILLSLLLIIGMAAGFQLFQHMSWRDTDGNNRRSSSVQQMLDLINMKYVDDISMDSLELAGIDGITNHLDPHSVFLNSKALANSEAEMTGNFSGVGIEYYIIEDTVMVMGLVEKGPANVSGIEIGDAIIAIEGKSITNIGIQSGNLKSLLLGKRGTEVGVTISRNGKTLDKTIIRGNIPLPSVIVSYMLNPTSGYIKINRFSETTFFEFMDAATKLNNAGMQNLVLDLRENGGGLLEEATKIADELLEDGSTIVSIKGAKMKTKVISAIKPGIFEKGPLVVLINENSASASEVLAGALQDNDRAIIVGRRSFGKGLVQEQFNLSNGGALRLTVARYFTPLGRSIQKPYEENHEIYQQEVEERAQNGTIAFQTDTIGKKIFTTRKGKKLYESGGISPDVFVPSDSSEIPFSMHRLFKTNLIANWAFDIYRNQKDSINTYQDPVSFNQNYFFNPGVWSFIINKAEKDSASLTKLNQKDKQLLEKRMKSFIVKYKWKYEGFYKLLNQDDSAILKSLEIFQTEKP